MWFLWVLLAFVVYNLVMVIWYLSLSRTVGRHYQRLHDEGECAEASVSRRRPTLGAIPGAAWEVWVRFETTGGQCIEAPTTASSAMEGATEVGSTVGIRYLPQTPRSFVLADDGGIGEGMAGRFRRHARRRVMWVLLIAVVIAILLIEANRGRAGL
jgi:hypothetical protein